MTTRTATDQPFDFNLNSVKAENELAPFRFAWATQDNSNRRFTMRHLEDLDIWDLMEGSEKGDVQAMTAAFKAALGDEWDDFRATPLPQYKLEALFKAYRAHCGQESGESQASSTS